MKSRRLALVAQDEFNKDTDENRAVDALIDTRKGRKLKKRPNKNDPKPRVLKSTQNSAVKRSSSSTRPPTRYHKYARIGSVAPASKSPVEKRSAETSLPLSFSESDPPPPKKSNTSVDEEDLIANEELSAEYPATTEWPNNTTGLTVKMDYGPTSYRKLPCGLCMTDNPNPDCDKLTVKLARHREIMHPKNPDVMKCVELKAEIVLLPTKSAKRIELQQKLDVLNVTLAHNGIFRHNLKVFKHGTGKYMKYTLYTHPRIKETSYKHITNVRRFGLLKCDLKSCMINSYEYMLEAS
jgi:hypothetical protein